MTSPTAATSVPASAERSSPRRDSTSACSVRATASALPTSRSWFSVVAGSPTAAASIWRRCAWMPRFCSAIRARRSSISPRIQASVRSVTSRLVRCCATRYSSTTALATEAASLACGAVATTSMTEAFRLRVTSRLARSASTTCAAAPGSGGGRRRREAEAGEPALHRGQRPPDGGRLGGRQAGGDRPAAGVEEAEPAGGALQHRRRQEDGDLVRHGRPNRR